ncbi:hypothetical protein [Marinobacterium aestuariivivens]|uniref:Uncharacterized protein n=1 Tax=Marinobacterium aestuariivivens TaxID=1698799 RepID=A0ABW2A986_9GAMM
MAEIRAPFAYSLLLDKGVNEKELADIGFRTGYWVHKEGVELAGEQLGIPTNQLLINPEKAANQRFKSKLRGNLASYLFEYDGAFRYSSTPDYMRSLGLEKCGDNALPVRVMDALHLEQVLYQVIARAKHLLGALDSKLVTSEHTTVFKDQYAPGRFKLRASGGGKAY